MLLSGGTFCLFYHNFTAWSFFSISVLSRFNPATGFDLDFKKRIKIYVNCSLQTEIFYFLVKHCVDFTKQLTKNIYI